MDPILDPLNDAQREAVLHGEGPLLVLAGAGSGKTRVIVHRVAHLVRDRGILPWHLLGVTFTNKAAGEMRERLERLLGAAAQDLWVQTFHAFGARFLRREAPRAGLESGFAIYDDGDQVALVKRILADLGLDDGLLSPRQALSQIDRWKNGSLLPDDVRPEAGEADPERALEVYRRYQAALRRAGAVDFGDLLLLPRRLLEEDQELRRRWAGRSGTSWWTSSRTPTPPSSAWCSCSAASGGTSARWGTTTRPSTPGAAPRCRTSSTSTGTSPVPRW